jgi:riboflavin synthase
MFTGIIEGLGTISGIQPSNQGKKITVKSDFFLENTKIGDSIALNGACLTAVEIRGNSFQVDVAPETLSMSILSHAKIGDRVNLERALRLSDRLDGHLVSGHVDGIGKIKERKNQGNAIIITVEIPDTISRYIIKKGSVAVDGVSLTVNACNSNSFQISIIPHTAKLTTVGFKRIGDQVNIETDMIGKYIERFITQKAGDSESQTNRSSIDMEFLAKKGFL